jgi:uncharacterized membrane protein
MKKYLLTGLVLLLPFALTLMVLSFLLNLFTTPLLPVVHAILRQIPILWPENLVPALSRVLALVMLCLFILGLGWVARHFLLKKTIHLTHQFFSHIPFVKNVYKVSRDLSSAFFSADGKEAFKETVLIPFPEKPYLCVGFSTGEAPEECQKKAGTSLTSVFAPTAPHPISGFLLFVPKTEVRPASMTKEDALKFFVSCGVVLPEEP